MRRFGELEAKDQAQKEAEQDAGKPLFEIPSSCTCDHLKEDSPRGEYPLGSVAYTPRSIKRRGARIRYITAGNVIGFWKHALESESKEGGAA